MQPMKTNRIISQRMVTAATPHILGLGRGGHVAIGYYPRRQEGKPVEKVGIGRLAQQGRRALNTGR